MMTRGSKIACGFFVTVIVGLVTCALCLVMIDPKKNFGYFVEALGAALIVTKAVREVLRGEGDWLKEVFPRRLVSRNTEKSATGRGRRKN